jgi:phospholipid/cholesterol/gamma-HCH transport system permease protein
LTVILHMSSPEKLRRNIRTAAANRTQKLADTAQKSKEKSFSVLRVTGDMTLFFLRFFREVVMPPYDFREIGRLCYEIGNKSLGLVSITGLIMGLVLTIQSRPTLEDFGAEAWLPGMVAISLVREIGPVITALLCAGKIGSSIGAELGSMKVTEQIDAMEVSGSNPYRYLVVTRILATTFTLPLLVFYADFLGLVGAYIGVNIKSDVSFFLFFSQAFASLDFLDIIPAVVKTVVFGFVIGFIGCYKGFHAGRGTESVGKSANAAVVAASLMIFLVDMVAVQVTDVINQFFSPA